MAWLPSTACRECKHRSRPGDVRQPIWGNVVSGKPESGRSQWRAWTATCPHCREAVWAKLGGKLTHENIACLCNGRRHAANRALRHPADRTSPVVRQQDLQRLGGRPPLFRIESGAIVAGTLTAKIERNEFLCTARKFKDFELRLSVKLLGGDQANAGVQFRTERIPNHHEVIGFQADMGAGWWGALYDESRRKRVLKGPDQAKMKDVIREGEWNDYTIRADGPRVQLSINGFQTVDYVETDPTVADNGLISCKSTVVPPVKPGIETSRSRSSRSNRSPAVIGATTGFDANLAEALSKFSTESPATVGFTTPRAVLTSPGGRVPNRAQPMAPLRWRPSTPAAAHDRSSAAAATCAGIVAKQPQVNHGERHHGQPRRSSERPAPTQVVEQMASEGSGVPPAARR